MKNYELVYVVKPNSDDETKESVLNKIKDVIFSNAFFSKLLIYFYQFISSPTCASFISRVLNISALT